MWLIHLKHIFKRMISEGRPPPWRYWLQTKRGRWTRSTRQVMDVLIFCENSSETDWDIKQCFWMANKSLWQQNYHNYIPPFHMTWMEICTAVWFYDQTNFWRKTAVFYLLKEEREIMLNWSVQPVHSIQTSLWTMYCLWDLYIAECKTEESPDRIHSGILDAETCSSSSLIYPASNRYSFQRLASNSASERTGNPRRHWFMQPFRLFQSGLYLRLQFLKIQRLGNKCYN